MLKEQNLLLVKEILHRLETKEPVSVDELIYLHQEASQNPDVDRWVKKLLCSEEFTKTALTEAVEYLAA